MEPKRQGDECLLYGRHGKLAEIGFPQDLDATAARRALLRARGA
jgi:hypothetical protein